MTSQSAFKDFDEYVKENNIQPDDLGEAFAKFLNKVFGWKGKFEEVRNDN